jgi:hypothetical protein
MRKSDRFAPLSIRGESECTALIFVLIRLDSLSTEAAQCSVKDFYRLDGYIVLNLGAFL